MFLKVFLLVALSILCFSQTTEKKVLSVRNVITSYTQTNTTWNFFFKTRSRYGYFLFGFSNSNSSMLGGAIFASWVGDYVGKLEPNITIYRYVPPVNMSVPKQLFQKEPWFIMDQLVKDTNYYPIGRYNDDINTEIELSKADFPWISIQKTYIMTGFSFLRKPKGPSNLTNLDEFYINPLSRVIYSDKSYFSPYARLESLHLAPFIIMLCFYPTVFIICFILLSFNKQPLASRGITPFFACIGHFLHLLSSITQFVYTLEDFKYNCIYLYFLQHTVILSLLFLEVFHFFRYVMIVNINIQKELAIKKKESNGLLNQIQNTDFKYKLLRIFGKKRFLVAQTILNYIFFTIIYIIGFASTKFTCDKRVFWSSVIFYIFGGIIVFLLIALFIYDFYLNFNKIIKCEIVRLWREDVFYYRIEIYFIGLFIVVPLWITMIFMNPDSFYVYSYDRPEVLIVSTFDSLGLYALFFMQCGFALIVTIFKAIVDCFAKKHAPNVIVDTLNDSLAREFFTEFVKNEWASENIVCYDDIQKYKSETKENKKQSAQNIFNLYLNGASSQLEVNVPRSENDKVKQKLESGEELKDDLFEGIENNVIINLCDNYSRFIKTNEYLSLKKKAEMFEYQRLPTN